MSSVYIDDADASVAYSGSWSAIYSQRAYHNTDHLTNSTNARATLTFTGISVMAYSVVRAGETPQSSYSLDGGDPTVFTAPSSFITQYGVLCYTSPVLRNGQHTLTVTNLGNVNNSLFLDYFIVVSTGAVSTNSPTSAPINTVISTSSTGTQRPDSASSVSGSRSSITSRSSSTMNTTLVTFRGSGSSSDVLPPSPNATQSGGNMDANSRAMPRNSRNTAAIIGAIAAVAIVILFSVIFMWLSRRRRKQRESESWIVSSSPGGAAAPTSTASLATTTFTSVVTPQMNERPPCYAMSEPPAYDADIGPAVQAQVQSDSRPLSSSDRGLQRSGKR